MVLVTKKIIRLTPLIKVFLAASLLAWPALCQAGVGKTRHFFCSHDEKKKCKICHSPHSNKSQQPLWIPDSIDGTSDITRYFTLPKEVKILCLGCHDGVIASDVNAIISPALEDLSELNLFEIKSYFSSELLLFSNTCEKHYYLVSYFREQLPEGELKCNTCHDVHYLKGSRRAGLISKNVYFKHKVCLNCHQL